jgi:hypothetical protein
LRCWVVKRFKTGVTAKNAKIANNRIEGECVQEAAPQQPLSDAFSRPIFWRFLRSLRVLCVLCVLCGYSISSISGIPLSGAGLRASPHYSAIVLGVSVVWEIASNVTIAAPDRRCCASGSLRCPRLQIFR